MGMSAQNTSMLEPQSPIGKIIFLKFLMKRGHGFKIIMVKQIFFEIPLGTDWVSQQALPCILISPLSSIITWISQIWLLTLIPKKPSPEIVNDYRPISVVNISPKLVSKLLADRLQTVIIELVHKNQYGFIKTRTIQDYLAWCFEYIHQCQQSRREVIILKLDFEKAFDTVEHSTILKITESMGFPTAWQHWIQALLSIASSAILPNGVARKFFDCKRGVRQGDPLSPLLFVLSC
jgi:hypothetical protein